MFNFPGYLLHKYYKTKFCNRIFNNVPNKLILNRYILYYNNREKRLSFLKYTKIHYNQTFIIY